MIDLFRTKLGVVLVSVVRAKPKKLIISILLKLLFMVVQVASIWLVFTWVTGGVVQQVVSVFGYEKTHLAYPIFAGVGLVVSGAFSLLSRFVAIQGIALFEEKIKSQAQTLEYRLNVGDFRGVAKLILAIIDVVVPAVFLFFVSVLWVYFVPVTAILIFIFVVLGFYFLRRAVAFSAGKYKRTRKIRDYTEYVGSDEHVRFQRVLLLPQYISLAIFFIAALLIVFSVVISKYYLLVPESYIELLVTATAIAFLQLRTFVTVIVRAGAFNQSVQRFHHVITST